MKKTIISIVLGLIFTISGYSQNVPNPDEEITIKKSDLSTEQLAEILAEKQLQEMQKKVETYGNWVGVGGEVGTAVKEALLGVVEVSDKFGKTDVGKFTMIMVAWKIIGKDIIRILLGLIFIIVFVILLNRSYRTYTVRRIVTESNGWKFWLPKKYTLVEPKEFDGFEFTKILHLFLLVGSFGITYAIMFS